MTNRCRICGEPKATQAIFDTHADDCDCAECCAVCWREFGQHCEEPNAGALLAEIARLRNIEREALALRDACDDPEAAAEMGGGFTWSAESEAAASRLFRSLEDNR